MEVNESFKNEILLTNYQKMLRRKDNKGFKRIREY